MTEQELLTLLPPFEARVRRLAIGALIERMRAGLDLVVAAQQAWEEHQSLHDRFQGVFEAMPKAGDPARAASLVSLFETVWGRRPDRRERVAITRGELSSEALRERLYQRLARLEGEAIVGLLAVSRLSLHAEIGRGPFWALALSLSRASQWRPVAAAFAALRAQADAGAVIPDELVERAEFLAADTGSPTWSQVAAIALLARIAPSQAAQLFRRRLHPAPSLPKDDCFVRAAAVRALVDVLADKSRESLARACDDPSEHVRMEVAAGLGRIQAAEVLRRMADPSCEASPRVRSAAVIALAPCAHAALATVLLTDPDELPRRIALEEAERLAETDASLLEAMIRAETEDASPNLRRLAAEAVERVVHRTDPAQRAILSAIEAAIVGDGRLRHPNVDPAALARALAVLAAEGHTLSATATRSGWRIVQGERKRRKLWRLLHECRHPSPDKRQSHLHTLGRNPRGEIRAPSGILAEVTSTRVPGEPRRDAKLGERARFLPSVDDLLSPPKSGQLLLASPFGITRLCYPTGRARHKARATLTLRYAHYADLREASLQGAEARERARFVEAITALGYRLEFEPFRRRSSADLLSFLEVPLDHRLSPAAGWLPFGEILHHAIDPSATTTSHVAAASVAMLGLFFIRLNDAKSRIKAARAAIPLTIGGWGTRGKSGTERLKAGLFQALGCEVLVKTTGCEAMLIHAIPDLPAREVFIYRTYDKATIWEQADVLELARRFRVDVFLWECMALKPEYVDILESHWMQDDFATLTNAYPDHEDIQGPAGEDIAHVMTNFISPGQPLFTAEDQMLPILADASADRAAELRAVRFRDYALLPKDLLDRFPYQEHPRNIALVLALAKYLGLDRDVALKEMADNVVPDLGVLKRYPEAVWRGRRVAFCNGMSANERTGHCDNWKRMGLDRHGPDTQGEWVMTVVNNRADRIARSHVFADIVVNDAHANRHVLVGTNLSGLRAYIDEALDKRLQGLRLFDPDELSLPAAELEASVLRRADRELQGVKLGRLGLERLCEEALAMVVGLGLPHVDPPEKVLVEALAHGHVDHSASVRALRSLAPQLSSFSDALGEHGPAATAHLLDLAARHATVLAWRKCVHHGCMAEPPGRSLLLTASLADFKSLYRSIFLSSLVTVPRSDATGDQIIDILANLCPPGFRATVMGLQNIKGTGLDFAYRWVALDITAALVRRLETAKDGDLLRVARELEAREGLGILDLSMGVQGLEQAMRRTSEPLVSQLTAIRDTLLARLRTKEGDLARTTHERSPVVKAVEKVADIYDGLWRRHRATRTLDNLIAGRLSHEGAALLMREVTRRQKGEWLLNKGRS